MLLHIRSPSRYSFMCTNKLLPLPCIRSIRNYLSLIKTSGGFDKVFRTICFVWNGLVSDGAQTNKKVWTELGIRGKLNECKSYVEHFVDDARKFFVFSDTPHLIKNVRDRLYNNRELLVIINNSKIIHNISKYLINF